MKTDNRAIGVFDSGLGGLTAVREMHRIMPQEHIVYFGDTGRVPYGTRSRDTIIKYARQDIHFLETFDLKAIVVACGTVSTVALDTVSRETSLPMFGVVEPSCRRALQDTTTGRIGIIGTPGSIRSGAYERTLRAGREDLQLIARACPLFVPLVENGRFHAGDIVAETIVQEYLMDIRSFGVDTLIMGCTHYPLLRPLIAAYMGDDVTLIDPGAEAARDAQEQLPPAADGVGDTQYFVTDDPGPFAAYAAMFLQDETPTNAEQIDISSY